MRVHILLLLTILALVAPEVLLAQAGGKNAGATAVPIGPPQPPPPAPAADYSYATDGRRDPFVSLFNRGTDARGANTKSTRPDGLAGITVDEVAVRGIVLSRGGYVAMIASPTGRAYTIRPGDRLMDGSVRAINSQAVVLMQEVNDPLSLEKHREVRKFLRGEVK